MGEVGDGSVCSPPKIEYLPLTENDDGSMGKDIRIMADTFSLYESAYEDIVARYCRWKNMELRFKLPSLYFDFSKGASDVALMQRGTIASSSKPCNLICSQTPDATLAIQTPSETACEQGPEFQHSSRAFSLGPAGMGNEYKAVGLQGFSVGSKIPECGVQTKKRPHPANETVLPSTRRRGPDFEDEEKGLLVRFKLEYLQDPANKGQSHAWMLPVTRKMKDHGYDRDPVSLRRLSDTLKKSHIALRRCFPQGTGYWDLTMAQKKTIKRDDCHFPLIFEFEWYDAMENIEKMKPRSAAEKQTRRDGQEDVFSEWLASTIIGSANFAGTDCLEEPGNEPDSESEAMGIPTDEGVLSGESGASLESHTEIASADSHGPRTEPSRKRSAASAFDEDNLFAQIRSYVNQQIEEALLPLMSALRSREEDEHKHRQKMLALEQEKLALMRQKLECTRRSNGVPASVAK